MLVFAYGMHVLTEVEVGATLVQEDQVSRELVGNEDKDRLNVTFAASVLFDRKVGVGDAVSWDKESQLVQAYQRGTVASNTQPRGAALLRGPHSAEVAGRRRQPAGGHRPLGPAAARAATARGTARAPGARHAPRGGGSEPRHQPLL